MPVLVALVALPALVALVALVAFDALPAPLAGLRAGAAAGARRVFVAFRAVVVFRAVVAFRAVAPGFLAPGFLALVALVGVAAFAAFFTLTERGVLAVAARRLTLPSSPSRLWAHVRSPAAHSHSSYP